uniref:Mcl1_mid domain-containing protein n=1 Tax=Macrostomum lignano TaxID=282301 RepID=A0A1I8H2S4_9PLAT
SECPFDSVLCLHDGGRSGGVWLAVRGSPVVELWSSDGSSCRLRFDIQTMTRPLQRLSEFDSDAAESTGQAGSANPFRVTSLLATGTRRRSGRRQLWVGTGSGDLIVFDVRNLNDGEDGFELDEEAGGSSSGSETDSEVFDTGGRAAARTPPSTPTVASLATVAEEEDKNEEERNSADQGGGRVAYSRDLELVVRNKVAESAIVCLIPARLDSPSGCIVSCSRRFGEDEAVLKWRPENSEQQIWTNEPVFEVNPVTRTIQLPTYMVVRNRIGSDRSIKEGRSVNRNDRSPKLSS